MTDIQLTAETVVAAVTEAAGLRPHEPAVTGSYGTLTFQQLMDRSAVLAARIAAETGASETPVGYLGDHGMALPVGYLGILRAGAALVPLDPEWPAARIAEVAERAGLAAVVAPDAFAERVAEAGLRLIPAETTGTVEASAVPVAPVARQLAYIVFTSGSTGRPKGVCVEHAALLNNCRGSAGRYAVGAGDRVLQFSELGVDIVLEELFTAWIQGAAAVLMAPDTATNFADFGTFLDTHQVSVLDLPVPFWLAWLDAVEQGDVPPPPSCVRVAAVGSDEVPTEAVRRWLTAAPGCGFANAYGSTEQTITSLIHGPLGAGDPVGAGVIGTPIPGVTAYVLDDGLRPVPDGTVGQLYVGGAAVARGYLGQTALTAERFLPDPFSATAGARMYASRDAVIRLKDGSLQYVGRMDRRVMVRGYTVEPAEVERIITAVPGVASVTVEQSPGADGRLRATVDAADDVVQPTRVVADVVAELAAKLPEYMRPEVVLRGAPAVAAAGQQPPRTATELAITEMWRELLGDQDIRPADNFFDLGGNSLLATQLLTRLDSRLGIKVAFSAFLEDATVAALAARVGDPVAEEDRAPLPPIEHRELPSTPASFGQERLWFLRQLAPDAHAYHEPFTYLIEGPVSTDALKTALRLLVERHPALHTAVRTEQGELVQRVVEAEPEITVTRADATTAWQEAADSWLAEMVRRPFDIESGQVLRAGLLRRDDEYALLCLVVHHIAVDAWSSTVLCRDLGSLYASVLEGRAVEADPQPVDYADFSRWQRELTETPAGREARDFWATTMAGAENAELPGSGVRGPVQDFSGASLRFEFEHTVYDRLRRLARREGVTLFQLLLGIHSVFVARHTGVWDSVIGTPVGNRHDEKLENVVGFLVNTVPVRADLTDNPRFTQAVRRIADQAVLAEQHAHVPFEHIVALSGQPAVIDRNPLFQTLFQLEEGGAPVPDLAGARVSEWRIDPGSATMDLSLTLRARPDRLDAILRFSTGVFTPEDMERMADRLRTLVSAVLDDPEGTVKDLPVLPAGERETVMGGWARTPGEPSTRSVPELVREVAADRPDAIAVVDGARELSYRTLQSAADATAARLISAQAGAYVPLLLGNGPELVVAMLAVLGSGSAFVPMDPDWPAHRIEQVIQRLGATVALSAPGAGPVPGAAQTIEIDLDAVADPAVTLPAPGLDAAAYVMFTSGSTGTPKGAVVTHRGLVNHLEGLTARLGARSAASILQTARPSFDHAVRQCLWPLTTGGRCVISPLGDLVEPARLVDRIERHAITTLNLVPSLFADFVDHCARDGAAARLASVHTVIVGGEALRHDTAAAFFELGTGAALFQSYGTSETAISSVLHEVHPDETDRQLPIGRPMPNTGALVLDDQLRPVPIGTIGELWLTGDCVGLGYLGDTAAGRRSFVVNPFPGVPGERIYRTGDLARWVGDGELELHGRRDRQVKVRGVRVEPADVESALLAHPGVGGAAVVLNTGQDDLSGLTEEALRSRAAQALSGLDPEQAAAIVHWARFLPDDGATDHGTAHHRAGGQTVA
ncbi:amino acid adenylation domain-containing protein [Streptomyces sp. NPDC052301]|uniref:amino acid adenylation domain-containing protein n=1 Tax=Streptomyces sp. NPDC052301 TaxID=3365687 RepID=UPI0037CDCCE5